MFKENPNLKIIFVLGFLTSLASAFTAYINSSFLAAFSGENYVSLIYVMASLTAILALTFVPALLRKTGIRKFLLTTSLLSGLCLLFLSGVKSTAAWAVFPIFIFYFAVNALIGFSLDELLQIFSVNSAVGRVRGFYLSLGNLAWVLAQGVVGYSLLSFSFSTLYFIGFVMMSTFFLVVFFDLGKVLDPKYDKAIAWESFKNFFKNENLARSYKINFLLQFFYVWMVVYTPIYLYAHLGFSWKEIGVIFTFMLLPFVLIEFPLGNYSDKIGERKMLMLGFLIISLSTLSLFFIHGHRIYIWAFALFMTRVGAAIIESMSDVYFFRHIKRENDEYISVYRNTGPLAYVLAPLVAFMAFSFAPAFSFIFLILGALLLYGVYLSSTIKKRDI